MQRAELQYCEQVIDGQKLTVSHKWRLAEAVLNYHAEKVYVFFCEICLALTDRKR